MRYLLLLIAACTLSSCATGGGNPDGSGGLDAGPEGDGGSGRFDAGPPPPRDGGRIRLPDAGPPTDSSFVSSCTSAADGTSCEADRNGCTEGDHCEGGVCVPGAPADCDDGMNCTTDRCMATSFTSYTCMNEVATAVCTIDGTCYSDGMTNPASSCQRCASSMSMSSWTVTAGAGCDDGDSCTSGDMCMADGTCAGSGGGDMYEANDTRTGGRMLGSISDGDSFPAGTLMPTLYPGGDEDWFIFHDSDDFGSSIFPRVDLSGIPAGQDYDLCAYYDCDGDPLLGMGCPSGTASSRDGLSGCCSAASGNANESVRLDPDCDPTDDSGTVYVRVFRFSGTPVCGAYTLRWGDD